MSVDVYNKGHVSWRLFIAEIVDLICSFEMSIWHDLAIDLESQTHSNFVMKERDVCQEVVIKTALYEHIHTHINICKLLLKGFGPNILNFFFFSFFFHHFFFIYHKWHFSLTKCSNIFFCYSIPYPPISPVCFFLLKKKML